MNQMPKCIGILGRLFGHKFIKGFGDSFFTSNTCFRCGLNVDNMGDK